MISVQPAGISAAQIALTLLRTEPPSKAAGGAVKTDLPAAPPLDAASRSVVSPRTSDAMASLSSPAFAIPTPEAIAKSMAATPPEEAARMRALCATSWVRREAKHLDDAAFQKAVLDLISINSLDDTEEEQKDGRMAAVLNGTLQIHRGSDVPEARYTRYTYDMYDSRGHYGSASGGTINLAYFKPFEIDNPGIRIGTGAIDDDTFIITWPKPETA